MLKLKIICINIRMVGKKKKCKTVCKKKVGRPRVKKPVGGTTRQRYNKEYYQWNRDHILKDRKRTNKNKKLVVCRNYVRKNKIINR